MMNKKAEQKRLFITWAEQDSRSASLAGQIGAKNYFIHSLKINNKLFAPLKYLLNTIKTLSILHKEDPDVIFIANPPIFAVLTVWLYCSFYGCSYVVDTHSAAFTLRRWSVLLWLYRFLSRYALLNLLHNRALESRVAGWKVPTMNLGDIKFQIIADKGYSVRPNFNVVFVSTFARDEPLAEIIKAARKLPSIDFYITGSLRKVPLAIINHAPQNVIFTDFLPAREYGALLQASNIVICLTKNDNTMQNGAYEACALGKPIITSNWPVLRRLYVEGAECIDNSPDEIVRAITRIKRSYSKYTREIKELRDEINSSWQLKLSRLLKLLDHIRGTTG